LQESANDFGMPEDRRVDQGRKAVAIARPHVGASLQKHAHDIDLTGRNRQTEGRIATRIRHVNGHPFRQESGHRGGITPSRRPQE
jgi:hypothetical protein